MTMPVTSTDQGPVPRADTKHPEATVPTCQAAGGNPRSGLDASPGDGASLTVFYDGTCAFCTSQAGLIGRHLGEAVRTVSTALPDTHQAWGLDPVRTSGEIIVRDSTGREWGGADAIARLLRASPRLAILGRAMTLPGIRQAAHLGYRGVARIRHRLARWS